MKPIIEKKIDEAVVLIKVLDNGELVVVDSKTNVRYFDKETMDLTAGFKGKISHLRYKTSVVDIDSTGEFLSSLSSDCTFSRLIDARKKKNLVKFDKHHGEVSCVAIDPTNRYMFSSGEDGKTFALDIKSGNIAFSLPNHADTINDIVFTENGQWVATAGYDKKVSIFNLTMMVSKHRVQIHSAPIVKMQFLSKHRLFSVDKRNKAIIFDVYSGKVIHRLQAIHDDVTQVTKSSDDKFLFIGTILGYVMVYELETYQLLSRNYVKLTCAITALEFDKETNNLIVGSNDGEILFYNIYKGEERLSSLLKNKEYKAIEDYASQNPILIYTKAYNSISAIWDRTLEIAKKFLENGDTKSAEKLFMPFKEIPSKNKLIQRTMKDYVEFDKFSMLVKQNKIPLAYSLANSHPVYKESKLYKDMEKKWKEIFTIAQKYALDPRTTDKAREILTPYRGVSEKSMAMQDIFRKGVIYTRFKECISKKDFRMAFELIKQNPFLKEFASYDTLMTYGNNLYVKAQKSIQEGNLHSAVKILIILVDFSEFSEEAKELKITIEENQKFFDAISKGNITVAYDIMDSSYDLQNTQEGAKLQEEWDEALDMAHIHASRGNVDGVKKVLEKYMRISSKSISIATTFAWCYLSQLKQSVRDKETQHVIENGIRNYIMFFGLQEQLRSFFEDYKSVYTDTHLDIEVQVKGSLKMWKPTMIVESIIN